MERGLVEQLDDPAMKGCLKESLCSFGIQYNKDRSVYFPTVSIAKEEKTERWFAKISSFEKAVR